jgi:hypothetical protein
MERHEVEQQLTRELGRDERLLWSGTPRQGVMFRVSDAFLIPFSLFWCGFAIFWKAKVITGGAPWFFALWGMPFVLVGLYMVAGRFIADSAERKRMVYGLTNERVIIIHGLFKRVVKSLSLRSLGQVSLAERPDGTGTITFASSVSSHRQPASALEGIADARAVYDQLRQAQKMS